MLPINNMGREGEISCYVRPNDGVFKYREV